MGLENIMQEFVQGIQQTGWLEYLAVFSGIASVWFSWKENILVYPVGLVNTVLYIYISLKGGLGGEAAVNFYYTAVSIYGWYLWSKKDSHYKAVLTITRSTKKEWRSQVLFFIVFYGSLFFALDFLKKNFLPGAIPWADAFASAAAFTGMWLMAKKKVESWYWWIITNIASVPLYFVKHYVFTSVYYLILLILAFAGLAEWLKKSRYAS